MARRNAARPELEGSELNVNLLTKHGDMIMVHHFMKKFWEIREKNETSGLKIEVNHKKFTKCLKLQFCF